MRFEWLRASVMGLCILSLSLQSILHAQGETPTWVDVQEAYDAGNVWKSLSILRAMEAATPNDPGVYQSLALVLEDLGAYDAASYSINRWESLDSSQQSFINTSMLRLRENKANRAFEVQSLEATFPTIHALTASNPREAVLQLRKMMEKMGSLSSEGKKHLIGELTVAGFPDEALMAAQRWVWLSLPEENGVAPSDRFAAHSAFREAQDTMNFYKDIGARVAFESQKVRLGTSKRAWRRNGKRKVEEDERPAHRVTLSSFELERYEVSVMAYRACQGAGICPAPVLPMDFDNGAQAMVGINWDQARMYCESKGGRLPTEAEWEFAARGKDKRAYPWGQQAPTCELAHYKGCERTLTQGDYAGRSAPVTILESGATPEGVMNLAGNVSEWVADSYEKEGYKSLTKHDPLHRTRSQNVVSRGGSFDRLPQEIRSARREARRQLDGYAEVGFRCAWD